MQIQIIFNRIIDTAEHRYYDEAQVNLTPMYKFLWEKEIHTQGRRDGGAGVGKGGQRGHPTPPPTLHPKIFHPHPTAPNDGGQNRKWLKIIMMRAQPRNSNDNNSSNNNNSCYCSETPCKIVWAHPSQRYILHVDGSLHNEETSMPPYHHPPMRRQNTSSSATVTSLRDRVTTA